MLDKHSTIKLQPQLPFTLKIYFICLLCICVCERQRARARTRAHTHTDMCVGSPAARVRGGGEPSRTGGSSALCTKLHLKVWFTCSRSALRCFSLGIWEFALCNPIISGLDLTAHSSLLLLQGRGDVQKTRKETERLVLK